MFLLPFEFKYRTWERCIVLQYNIIFLSVIICAFGPVMCLYWTLSGMDGYPRLYSAKLGTRPTTIYRFTSPGVWAWIIILLRRINYSAILRAVGWRDSRAVCDVCVIVTIPFGISQATILWNDTVIRHSYPPHTLYTLTRTGRMPNGLYI